jgi:hypothetical protein
MLLNEIVSLYAFARSAFIPASPVPPASPPISRIGVAAVIRTRIKEPSAKVNHPWAGEIGALLSSYL